MPQFAKSDQSIRRELRKIFGVPAEWSAIRKFRGPTPLTSGLPVIRPAMYASSNTLVHERSKVSRVLEQVAPFRVIACPRFSRDNFR
jgi:hypothetical protein